MKLSKESIQGKLKAKEFLTRDHVKALETALELYTDLEKAQLNEACAIHDQLCAQAELADIHNSHKFIMDEKCSSQEKHCGCVPLLRAELTALKAANELQLQAMIENQNKFLLDKQNKFLLDKLRDLQRRFNELKTELAELHYAVCTKFPNESRHQTALRYITEAENRPCMVGQSKEQADKEVS